MAQHKTICGVLKVMLNTNQPSDLNLGQWAYNNSDKLCTSSIDAA